MKWIKAPQGIITIDELESFMVSSFEGKTKSVYEIMNNGFPDVTWTELTDEEKRKVLDKYFKPMRDYLPSAGLVIEAYTNEKGIFQFRYIKEV